MSLLVLKVSSTVLAALLALVPMFVDLRTPERARLRIICFIALLLSAGTSVISQVVELKSRENTARVTLQRLLRLQTRLKDIKLEAQFLASKEAILPRLWDCLKEGNESRVIYPFGAPRGKGPCSPKVPIKVSIGLCKSAKMCRQTIPSDLAADFGNFGGDCIESIRDEKTSLLRIRVNCSTPEEVRPYLESISLSELQEGCLQILVDAKQTAEYPNSAALRNAALESAIVWLNGVPVKLERKDFHNLPLESSLARVHDLTPR